MSPAALRTEGLTKRFGDRIAVEGLDLEVPEGEIFGFLGPNGAGKTTTIRMICGLLRPDAGRIFLHGERVNGGPAGGRVRVGVCPQEIVVWPKLECLEQLELMGTQYDVPAAEARRRGRELLEALGLEDQAGRRAATLSGGMQRRLNLALALVHDPDLVVLDEPEAGLDPQGRVRVREYVRSLARRKTVLLTTHNMDEAERLADRVAVIDHGALLRCDTPEALKRHVGAGDVLELRLGRPEARARAEAALASLGDRLTLAVREADLLVRGRDLVAILPDVLGALQQAGVRFTDVRLRENSLEDVFLHLTGRSLRE